MENKRAKLNQAVDGGANFIAQVISGEDATFSANVIFCLLAKTIGEMGSTRAKEIIEAAAASCTFQGCECMEVRKRAAKLFADIRRDYVATMRFRNPRCLRFAKAEKDETAEVLEAIGKAKRRLTDKQKLNQAKKLPPPSQN